MVYNIYIYIIYYYILSYQILSLLPEETSSEPRHVGCGHDHTTCLEIGLEKRLHEERVSDIEHLAAASPYHYIALPGGVRLIEG